MSSESFDVDVTEVTMLLKEIYQDYPDLDINKAIELVKIMREGTRRRVIEAAFNVFFESFMDKKTVAA